MFLVSFVLKFRAFVIVSMYWGPVLFFLCGRVARVLWGAPGVLIGSASFRMVSCQLPRELNQQPRAKSESSVSTDGGTGTPRKRWPVYTAHIRMAYTAACVFCVNQYYNVPSTVVYVCKAWSTNPWGVGWLWQERRSCAPYESALVVSLSSERIYLSGLDWRKQSKWGSRRRARSWGRSGRRGCCIFIKDRWENQHW